MNFHPPPSPQTADSNQVIALNAELEPAISQDTDDVNQTVITNNRPQEPAANISSAQSVKQPQLSTEPQQPHEISFPVKVNIEALDKLMNLVSEMGNPPFFKGSQKQNSCGHGQPLFRC